MKSDDTTGWAVDVIEELTRANLAKPGGSQPRYSHVVDPQTGEHQIIERDPQTFEDKVIARRGGAE